MNTLICAGGTGTRILEAIIHLCAAGAGPPALRLLVIDPDKANGNGDRLNRLVERYQQCHAHFSGRLGDSLRLFGTRLDLFEVGSRSEGLRTWSPVDKGVRLGDILNYELLDSTPTPRDLVHLFFHQDELTMSLDQGFRGHPSVGAAAMALVALQADKQPWRQVVEKIRGDLAHSDGARVFLAGSVFGGTGVSTFFPIARFLRTVPEVNSDRLKIGVAALSPYFRFEAASTADAAAQAETAARAELFPVATRSAVDFYEHLRSHDTWPFDVFFWAGDDQPVTVPYSPGGPAQTNPSHFAELLAALGAFEFFGDPSGLRASCYAGWNGDPVDQSSSLDWPELPLGKLSRVSEDLHWCEPTRS